LFSGGNVILHMSGNTVKPCPVCGGTGHIPDGTYELVDDALSLLQGPQRTKDELRRFADILSGVAQGATSVEQAQVTVQHEMPDLAPLVEELGKARSAEFRMFLLKMILTAISLLVASQTISIQDVKIDVDTVVDVTIERETQPPPDAPGN
jgi:hypothetical protein